MSKKGVRLTLSAEVIATLFHALEICQSDYSQGDSEYERQTLEEIKKAQDALDKAMIRKNAKGEL
jgi:hypothetical protein